MKKLFLQIACITSIFMCFGQRANACGFEEVIAGLCPAEEFERSLAYSGTNERAVVYAGLTWGKYKQFSKLGNSGDIVLNVCIFREGAQTIFAAQPQMISFAGSPDKFETVGKAIEKAASSWTSITGKASDGSALESRLTFNFRTSSDKKSIFRACEETQDNHILISLNSSSTNFSAIGWKSVSAASSTKSPRASMTLFYHGGSINAGTARHEFGHALGFLHEMAHSKWAACAKAFLVKDYIKSSGYTFGDKYSDSEKEALAKANIQNLVEVYKHAADPSDNFDSSSIMTYKLEDRFFDPGVKTTGLICAFNKDISVLSDTDKKWYLRYYGRKS